MRVLGTESPRIYRVGDATPRDPSVGGDRRTGIAFIARAVQNVIVVLEHAADAESAESEVETGLVEVLLLAVRPGRFFDVPFKGTARPGGQPPTVAVICV